MAGLKTGSMFNCPVGNMKEFTCMLRNFNKTCSGKGVRILPLKISGGNALVYMYRPSKLRNDLSDKRAASLLKSRNYPTEKCEGCLLELIKRLRSGGDFPHEVGLFLGYPPEDVHGFIKSRAKHAKPSAHGRYTAIAAPQQNGLSSMRNVQRSTANVSKTAAHLKS